MHLCAYGSVQGYVSSEKNTEGYTLGLHGLGVKTHQCQDIWKKKGKEC